MINLSKESKITFMLLLVIPFVWIILNHLGYLDYLNTKTLDWRMQFRGEIPQDLEQGMKNQILVEDNKSIPRIPKLTYVNFDASTLAMDGVGERPWDRAFFRDTALALLERGNARVLSFDFGFTPKSMSSMVPKENSFRSDFAMGELIEKYPSQVVLGCLYSGVPTPFVKPAGASAFPPLFHDGFSLEASIDSKKFHYPESPTYPLLSYGGGKYLGRMGSFTVPPFRAVDEIPRWVPLWFPSMGKAHAYNLLGGKQSKLEFELPVENVGQIKKLTSSLQKITSTKGSLQKKLTATALALSKNSDEKAEFEKTLKEHLRDTEKIKELTSTISNLQNALKGNPALSGVLEPQIFKNVSKRDAILVPFLDLDSNTGPKKRNREELSEKLNDLEKAIANFTATLNANPALEAVIKVQLDARIQEKEKIKSELGKLEESIDFKLSPADIKKASDNLSKLISSAQNSLKKITTEEAELAQSLSGIRKEMELISNEEAQFNLDLIRLQGKGNTEIIETNNTLRLIYERKQEDLTKGTLVDSLPNEVPLNRDRNMYTLGVESLLAYYGLDSSAVEILDDGKHFVMKAKDGSTLVDCELTEKQFLEVNWFSKWTEEIVEKKLMMEAKRAYGDEDYEKYLELIPSILTTFLNRVDNLEVNDESDLLEEMRNLGLDEKLIIHAEKLIIQAEKLLDNDNLEEFSILDQLTQIVEGIAHYFPQKNLDEELLNNDNFDDIPSFDQLTQIVEGIAYYFIPPSLESSFNPMCGMRDVLQNAKFQDQVSSTIQLLEEKIQFLEGSGAMGKIEKALLEQPENETLLAKKMEVEAAIATNKINLTEQKEELSRINEFFACFENAIVLLGPEEKTFQDLAPTPFDSASVPKVSVHGNLIKMLTNDLFISRYPKGFDHAATLVICLIMAILAVYQGNRASLVQSLGILFLIGYVYFGFLAFEKTQAVWPIAAPACAGLSTSFIGLAAMVVIEQKAKGRLKGMFGSYVSSDLVEQMVESGEEPSLGGEETSITAFFSDVQAFSSFSELLSPTGLVDLMNEYLTAMTDILTEERGTLDKYIGDAIVAMYGAPVPMEDHAYQSVRTALLMQQKQLELRDKWSTEAEKWGKCHDLVCKMQTRIGCNTGTATVGNMGALDRFNYTMMGDMVNLAARCESGAKAYGAYIMITEETKLASVQTKDDIAFRYLDRIVVKGRSQPVAMYEPTGFMDELSQETQDCLDCFSQGIEKYLAQDWDTALQMFEKAKGMEPNKPGITPGVKDNPSMILIDRCQVMKENPPGDDWDGVYVMTTK
jgi:class 3 adenylate cyclase/tetratricopeptide (TPR) repeat protein